MEKCAERENEENIFVASSWTQLFAGSLNCQGSFANEPYACPVYVCIYIHIYAYTYMFVYV